ncbi:zf-TFIIB domain-containing protein (plasmid) [Polaromonas sp. P1-6]|nr:zf-TFIIB domain-containing protein [Polaromonas sp. P1-6]
MKCPNCNDVTLVMAERQGVEIDYCPQCRGVWLDRGELDKLIERSAVAAPVPQPVSPQAARRPDFEDSDFRHNAGHGKRKPKSWLSEIFD